MINISFETHPEFYTDYEKALEYLRESPDLERSIYPPYKVYYHLYSEINNEKELLSVKSYFATQNLHNTQLILWSDWDVRKNELLAPYKDLIDFRVFDPLGLAIDTPIEGNTEQLLASDSLHYMKSGMLRFLAPYQMGGVWFDMDMVLLRNLVPILFQEFAYMWGSETDFAGHGPCAAFMNIHERSDHASLCLEEMAKAPIIPNTVCRDHELLAKVYKRRPFTVFPSAFFNTEWQINVKTPGLGTKIEGGWFKKNEYSDYLFSEAFSWHWHNSCFKDHQIEEGSKFHNLNKLMDWALKEKGIL